jgi:hypothetical protein
MLPWTRRTLAGRESNSAIDEAESRKDNAPVRGATTTTVVILTRNTGLCIR